MLTKMVIFITKTCMAHTVWGCSGFEVSESDNMIFWGGKENI